MSLAGQGRGRGVTNKGCGTCPVTLKFVEQASFNLQLSSAQCKFSTNFCPILGEVFKKILYWLLTFFNSYDQINVIKFLIKQGENHQNLYCAV